MLQHFVNNALKDSKLQHCLSALSSVDFNSYIKATIPDSYAQKHFDFQFKQIKSLQYALRNLQKIKQRIIFFSSAKFRP